MPQTYIRKDADSPGRTHFLFVDERAGLLTHVEQGPHTLFVRCVGSVEDRMLRMAERTRLRENAESYLSLFADEQGRTPLENFDVVYVEGLDTSRCDAKRY